MRFTIAADEFRKGLARAAYVAEKKSSMPILQNVLLETAGDGIKVTAFDGDMAIVSEHPAEVEENGAITLPVHTLHNLVKAAPDGRISLRSVADFHVELVSGKSKFRIGGVDPTQYPPLPKEESASMAKVDGAVLLDMLKKTHFAILTEDSSRPTLAGILLENSKAGVARMVATDGHQLAVADGKVGGKFKLKASVILPRKGATELMRLIEEAPDAEMSLGTTESACLVSKPGLSMMMRLVDGTYPEYQRALVEAEKTAGVLATVDRKAMLDVLKRISLLGSDVRIAVAKGSMDIGSRASKIGDGSEDLAAEYAGPEVASNMDASLWLNVLGAADTERVAIAFGDGVSPVTVRPVGDDGYTAIIMPIARQAAARP